MCELIEARFARAVEVRGLPVVENAVLLATELRPPELPVEVRERDILEVSVDILDTLLLADKAVVVSLSSCSCNSRASRAALCIASTPPVLMCCNRRSRSATTFNLVTSNFCSQITSVTNSPRTDASIICEAVIHSWAHDVRGKRGGKSHQSYDTVGVRYHFAWLRVWRFAVF